MATWQFSFIFTASFSTKESASRSHFTCTSHSHTYIYNIYLPNLADDEKQCEKTVVHKFEVYERTFAHKINQKKRKTQRAQGTECGTHKKKEEGKKITRKLWRSSYFVIIQQQTLFQIGRLRIVGSVSAIGGSYLLIFLFLFLHFIVYYSPTRDTYSLSNFLLSDILFFNSVLKLLWNVTWTAIHTQFSCNSGIMRASYLISSHQFIL